MKKKEMLWFCDCENIVCALHNSETKKKQTGRLIEEHYEEECTLCYYGRRKRYPHTHLLNCDATVSFSRQILVDIPISNCINSGYTNLSTQSVHCVLAQTCADAYRFDRFGKGFVEILSAEQTEDGDDWYQGTADAVRRNLIHFGAQSDDIFVILSGDQLLEWTFQRWLRST